jgi:hypothetical protein
MCEEKDHVEVSGSFAVLQGIDAKEGTKSAWESIRENMKISARDSLG